MLHLKRLLRRVVFGLSVLVAAVLCLAFSAPLWINETAVKSEIAGLMARATGDVVEINRIQLRYFPLPGVLVSHPKYAVAGVAEIEARSAAIGIDFRALLSGRVQPRVVNLTDARISLRLPAGEADAESPSLEALDLRIGQFVAQVMRSMPELQATLDDARVEVLVGDRPPMLLQAVRASVSVSGGSIDVELACSSNLWERLALRFRLSAAAPRAGGPGGADPGSRGLNGAGRIDMVGLQVNALQSLLGLASASPVAEAVIVGRIDWSMQGLRNLNADLTASAAQLILRRRTHVHTFSGVTLAAGFQSRGNTLEANLHRLYLRSPHLILSAKLTRNQRGVYALEGDALGVDVDDLLVASRDLAPDISWIAQPPFGVRGGTLSALRLSSQADSPADLLRLERLQLEAALEGVGIDLPHQGIRIRDVAGRFALAHGELRMQSLTARLGASVLRNARLATDLLSEPIVLNAEAELALDLPESLALAQLLLPASRVRSELDDLEQIKGRAIVRLAMEGSLGAPLLRVDVPETNLVARHRAVPLPMRITRAQATYAADAFSLHAVDGHVGHSSFTGLDASFSMQPPYRFDVRHGRAALSAAELFRWAATHPGTASTLAAVKHVAGTIELAALQLQGTLRKPGELQFRILATPRGLVVAAPDLGPEFTIDGGVVELSKREVDLRNVGVAFADAALLVSGRIPDYRKPGVNLDASASGTLGAEALAWIYHTTGTPRPLQMRAPIEVADAALQMRGMDDVSFKGGLRIAGGPALSVEGRRDLTTVEIGRATVKDADSDASFGAKLADGNAEAWFKGWLSGKTLPRAFAEPAFAIGEIRGDLAAKVDLAKLEEAAARGHLEGSAIDAGQGLPIPLVVENFALEANPGRVVIKQAELSSGESRIALTGTIERRDNKFIVDAELSSDRIVAPAIVEETGTAGEQAPNPFDLSKVPFEGRVGVNIKKVEFGSREIVPLIASATLADSKLDLGITNAALCGINLSGTATGSAGDLRVKARMQARGTQLAGSIACLTGEHIQASGTVDLDAQVTAEGAMATLYRDSSMSFSLTARDGHLRKLDALKRVFDLLNVTEVVRGEKLEFGSTGLPYRTISAHGKREGRFVHLDEVILDAPSVQIVATGRVDNDTGKLSADVLVAPLQTANYVFERMPLMNRIFGGSVLAVPVRISGTLTDPIVVPLGPGAVARRLADVIGNVLELPVDAIKIFSPGTESQDKRPPGRNPN